MQFYLKKWRRLLYDSLDLKKSIFLKINFILFVHHRTVEFLFKSFISKIISFKIFKCLNLNVLCIQMPYIYNFNFIKN